MYLDTFKYRGESVLPKRVRGTILPNSTVAYAQCDSAYNDLVHEAVQAAVLTGELLFAMQLAAREGFYSIEFRWHAQPNANYRWYRGVPLLYVHIGQAVSLELVRERHVEFAIVY